MCRRLNFAIMMADCCLYIQCFKDGISSWDVVVRVDVCVYVYACGEGR